MSNNKNNKEVSLGLIIFLFFVFPPAAIILIIVKYILPNVVDILSAFGLSPKKKNRYSDYEKKGEDVFREIWKNATKETASGESAEQTAPRNTAAKKEKATKKEKQKLPYQTASLVLLIIAGVFLFSGVVSGISLLFENGLNIISPDDLAASITTLALGGMLGGIGLWLRRRMKTNKKYMSVIGKRGLVRIDELVRSFSLPHSKIKKELQSVIDSGVFGEYAYIDLGQNIFLRDSSFKPKEETPKEETQKTTANSDVGEYEATLLQIRILNDKIEDAHVSERIDLIEQHTRRIFEYIKKNPEREKDIRVFLTYYLPTTLKLLESYSEIERVGVAGENMKSAKENIEKTLDLLVEAYKRLLDQLYQSDNMDISSDIDVLEKMMKKDGLTGKGFGAE